MRSLWYTLRNGKFCVPFYIFHPNSVVKSNSNFVRNLYLFIKVMLWFSIEFTIQKPEYFVINQL